MTTPYPGPPYPAAPYPAPAHKTTSGLSITAFVLAFLVAPVGLALGIVALIVDGRRPDRSKGLSIAAIAVAVVMVILAVAAVVLWVVGGLIADVACGELAGGCPNRGPFF